MPRSARPHLRRRRHLHVLRRRAVPCVLLGSALVAARAQPAQSTQDSQAAPLAQQPEPAPQPPTRQPGQQPDQPPNRQPDQQPAALPDAPSTALAEGLVFGSVRDTNGDPVANAAVTLQPSSGSAPPPVRSDAAGRFAFPAVPPGAFSLAISLPGFATATTTGTLEPAATLTLPAVTLRLAVSTTVDAVDAHALAEQQIHTEEQQRLIGILPNFFVSYEWFTPPLSAGQKFRLAWRSSIDPGSFFSTGVTAGIQQATDSFPGYGQGLAGFGRRYGADYGDLVSGTFLGGAILPTLFRQDPRYFWKGSGSIRSRTLYAITRPFVARGDNGRWQPAYASVLGDFSSGALSNAYYPASDRHGAQLTIENGFLGLGGDAINDLFQEFVLKRFTPKSRKLPPTAP